jgi:mono/diheme cytochrome c family protein
MRHLVLTLAFSALLANFNDVTWSAGSDSENLKTTGASSTESKPQTGNSIQGKELYNASCVVCHGALAKGGVGPRLAGNPVLSNDQAFWKVVYEGRHVMPPLKDAITEQQMADIRSWLNTLR